MCRKAGKGRKIQDRWLARVKHRRVIVTGPRCVPKVAYELGALLVVDTVASLSAVPLHVDRDRIEFASGGSQKSLSARGNFWGSPPPEHGERPAEECL